MKAYILTLATALPQYCLHQQDAAEFMIRFSDADTKTSQFIKKLHQNSAINTRYMVLPEPMKPTIKMTARNEIYKQQAPKLAYQAALQALNAWSGSAKEITHIISVSCTGVMAPGIEFKLVENMHLNRNVKRFGINFMGCFGAFTGIALAKALAMENHSHRILVVCTELCSIHIQPMDRPDAIVANTLFGDGSAAVIVGCQPKQQEHPLCEITNHQSYALEATQDKMTWDVTDTCFMMGLSKEVPRLISDHIQPFMQSLVSSRTDITLCDWAIHPGGKEIIKKIEEKAKLKPEQTEASWNTLAEYGNMSSATILFALEKCLKQNQKQKWCGAIGIGPGLSFEGLLLKYGI